MTISKVYGSTIESNNNKKLGKQDVSKFEGTSFSLF